tara:strand:+ start:1016 stop:1471 length:456 start_codon:yes stop_codon:yes gene_type:complete
VPSSPERQRELYQINKDKIRARQKAYYEATKDSRKAKSMEYYNNNKEEVQAKNRIYGSQWKKDNKDKVNAATARRRAARLSATPPWLSEEELKEVDTFYMISQWYSEDMHVDHIIPLQGKGVCGLHVPWNLQVIPALDNLVKGNVHVSNVT